MEEIKIYTSKKKSFLLLIGAITFVVLGLWMIFNTNDIATVRYSNSLFIRGIGILSVLFFGFGIFVSISRLIKTKTALIINSEGVNINPKKSITEFIKWEEILGFEEVKIKSTRIILINIKSPNYWIEKETSMIRKKLMQFNLDSYGTPFNIASSALDINSNELILCLNNSFEKYKEVNK